MNEMDLAADRAKTELPEDLTEWTAADLARWFAENYRTAGHKRLGRIVVKLAKAA